MASTASERRGALLRAYDAARAAGDVEAMTAAAAGLSATRIFGSLPGKTPALLYEAYSRAEGAQRARAAVALARTWAYSGSPQRAVVFAAEAGEIAKQFGDPALLAAALDAQLLVSWGPDELDRRLAITAQLEDAVAHLTDVDARMSAHLWRLTTALECLDVPGILRQLRALDALAEETGSTRVTFFAASRRGMFALLTGDLAAARQALVIARQAGEVAGEADTTAIEHTLVSGIARQTNETATLAKEAAAYEEFGLGEGVLSVAAEGARLWVEAGELERGRSLLHRLSGTGFAAVPRDLDWLLTVSALTDVAVATGAEGHLRAAVTLLEPYAGRAVVNAGAVGFEGVVADYLCRALLALGEREAAHARRRVAISAYERIGASWWLERISGASPKPAAANVAWLHRTSGGHWKVGFETAAAVLPDAKGLQYLHLLLSRPGTDVSAQQLSDAANGHASVSLVQADLGPVVDRQAIGAYRARVAQIDEELDEARDFADSARAERLCLEREALIGQIAAVTGLAGRTRPAGSDSERARVAVRKAIASALGRLEQVQPTLARHLRHTIVTGQLCRYEPDPDRPLSWVLDDVCAPRA